VRGFVRLVALRSRQETTRSPTPRDLAVAAALASHLDPRQAPVGAALTPAASRLRGRASPRARPPVECERVKTRSTTSRARPRAPDGAEPRGASSRGLPAGRPGRRWRARPAAETRCRSPRPSRRASTTQTHDGRRPRSSPPATDRAQLRLLLVPRPRSRSKEVRRVGPTCRARTRAGRPTAEDRRLLVVGLVGRAGTAGGRGGELPQVRRGDPRVDARQVGVSAPAAPGHDPDDTPVARDRPDAPAGRRAGRPSRRGRRPRRCAPGCRRACRTA
jgi:hypothetical protein